MLELTHLCAGYGKKQILKEIDIRFSKGELTAIIGPNGCGKTTLLKAAIGLLRPMEGEIRLDSLPLGDRTRAEIARRVAYLSQSKEIPAMTVEQLVLHGRFAHLRYPRMYSERDRQIAAEAMERMGLASLAAAPLSRLSGGMRQSAYIAMALAQQSDYILLDEPTANLDVANRFRLMETLRGLAADRKGVVAVLHDLTLAMEYAHKIAVIEAGRLLICDTAEAVFSSGILNRVFGVELKRAPVEDGFAYYCAQDRART